MMKFDKSEIGEIHCTLNFDEDWYEEYLSDNGLQDSPEERAAYIRDNCDYEVEYYDSETYHSMGEYDTMTIDEIEENFGEAVAADVFRECMDGKEHSFEPLAYDNETINVNNPDEVNAMAVRVLRHGDYFKGCRGFILTNGVVVYTESEHNTCTRITGVKGTSHFIELGNIRVLDHSVDINVKPTPQQIRTLWKVLDSYYGEVLYLDMFNKNIGRFSQMYQNCNPERVMNDINSYFNRKSTYTISEGALRKIISESISRILGRLI